MSRASGTNVSFTSSYSAIKNNITRFKNKDAKAEGKPIESASKHIAMTPAGKNFKHSALKTTSITLENLSKKESLPNRTPKPTQKERETSITKKYATGGHYTARSKLSSARGNSKGREHKLSFTAGKRFKANGVTKQNYLNT